MKHLKSYKLFESIQLESKFPDVRDIEEIFYDVSDEGIIEKAKFTSMGYISYPHEKVINWRTDLRRQFYEVMYEHPNDWINIKPEDLHGDTWKDLFLDASDDRNEKMLIRYQEFIDFEDVKKSISTREVNKISNKTYMELLIENIENGNIRAYPYIMIEIKPYFLPENINRLIECLQRVYQATGFRPVKAFWNEDYVDEENGDVVTFNRGEILLVSTDDASYKNIFQVNAHNLDKEIKLYNYFL